MSEHFSKSTLVLNTLYRLAEQDPRAAITLLSEEDAVLADDIHYVAFRPGILINVGSMLHDFDLIREGVNSLAELLATDDPRINEWRRVLLYNLGNGYSELAKGKRQDGHNPDEPLLQQTKQAYRDAILTDAGSSDSHLLAEVYTNYGNALSACGRHYEALLAYDEAVRIEPTHSMALGNKGIELERYAFLARNQSGLLLAEAYELCRTASEDQGLDDGGLAPARSVFAKHRDFLEPVYMRWRDRLEAVRSRTPADTTYSRLEEHHHRFAVEHGLYLTLCVHTWPCADQHSDSLFFSYVAPLKDTDQFSRLARYFNQAKEDYATARYLLATAMRPTSERQRISDRTIYADVLEYAEYGLTPGLAKIALSTAYNVLDKIAVFLKWDLGLSERERDVNFRRVWRRTKAQTLRPEFLTKDDPSLFALYDISLDLRNPLSERLGAVRHTITHRQLVAHDFQMMVGENSAAEEHILLDDLIGRGIELLRLVKAALIYLAAYLGQDQERKVKASSGIVPSLPITWQHEIRKDTYRFELDE